jgi:uroporphyrinogen-III decarboxylase
MPDDLLRGNEPQIYAHYVYGLEHAPGVDFHGRPMAPPGPVFATASHPWTTACDLRGVTELCLDIYEDPDYVHLLMSFVTDASIARAKAWRRDAGMPVQFDPSEAYTLADDAIALLSPDAYREFVLPYHQRIVREMGGSERTRWHLCGEVGQHFETLVTEFGAESFDVGSCTDLAEVRRRLGPEVEFLGNIDPVLLLQGTVDDIENAVRRTMTCGVMEGGRYIMREGSNVAPRTPVRNLRAMYEAGKATGVYRA